MIKMTNKKHVIINVAFAFIVLIGIGSGFAYVEMSEISNKEYDNLYYKYTEPRLIYTSHR